MDRRQLLTGLSGAALTSISFGLNRSALGEIGSRPVAASLRDLAPECETVDGEELAFYRYAGEVVKLARAAEPLAKDIISAATVLPFMTMPVYRFAGFPDWLSGLPEPALQPLLDEIVWTGGHGGITPVQRLLRALWQPLPSWQCTRQLTAHDSFRPARLVTVKWVFDTEDTQNFNCHNVAMVLWQMVHGLRSELLQMQRSTEDTFRAACSGVPSRRVFQHRPISAACKLDAYMLEMFAWTTCFGYISLDRD